MYAMSNVDSSQEREARSPQQLNQEFKDILNLFPPPSNLPLFQTVEGNEDGNQYLDVNPEALERYRNRQNGELREALFGKLTNLASKMQLTPSGRADLLGILDTDFALGIPNADLPIEERVTQGLGKVIGDFIDAKNPESAGVFDKKIGRRVEENRYKSYLRNLDRKKERGRDIKPEELSKKTRWEKDLYGNNRAIAKAKQLFQRK